MKTSTRKKELGGGTTLDLGVYCVQLAQLVFGERPAKILSGGHLNADEVDECVSTTLVYSKGRTATLLTHARVFLPNEAIIIGTKKTLKLPDLFWCPTKLEQVGGEVLNFPLPPENMKPNFDNPTGLQYQCREVRKCILEGI